MLRVHASVNSLGLPRLQMRVLHPWSLPHRYVRDDGLNAENADEPSNAMQCSLYCITGAS